MPRLGIVELRDGHRLIVRDGGEVLIPKSAREEIIKTLHLTHPATDTMILQTRGKIFWPKMRQELKDYYEKCDACTMHRNSRPQKANEISMANLFNNFYPNQRVQIDFCEKGRDDYLVMVDVMSGFFQVYKVKNKSASEAVLKVREWSSSWGRPFEIFSDSGPGFRQTFEEECLKLGITVKHSSGYNSSSQSHVERCVGQLKSLLKKCGNLNQLQIHEMTYTINCREQNSGMGSPIARFLGRNCRGAIPNSLDRNGNWQAMMDNRARQHQLRVDKKGKTPKEMYEIGEKVLVQDVATRQWSKEGTVISIRTAMDGTVVSYVLDINGYETARHRKFLRKLVLPNDRDRELRGTGSDRVGSQADVQPAHSQEHEEAQQALRRSNRLAGHHGVL